MADFSTVTKIYQNDWPEHLENVSENWSQNFIYVKISETLHMNAEGIVWVLVTRTDESYYVIDYNEKKK
jgi:hypothetical protein